MKTFAAATLMGALLATAWVTPAAFAQSPSAGDTLFHATTLNLSAYGETRIAPDMASISLGVNTDAPTAAQALTANAAQMNRVMTALTAAGVAAKDIQTSNLSLNAQYDYEANQSPKLRGYQATNTVTIIVHDLKKLGQAVDATVKAGVNQVNGISFGVSDPSAAEDAARQKAVKALLAKANLYANASGYKVARLVSLSESGGYQAPQPMPMMAMARMEKDAGSPVAGGELSLRIDVSAVYELNK
ncbi:MAG: hypothetical protein CFE28_07190 [Alphaproteobacteria bacterium PA2]|nr:MAG: hypothetical protein CFE28_07190 [Alphaproteobacteria bacterium PA2]